MAMIRLDTICRQINNLPEWSGVVAVIVSVIVAVIVSVIVAVVVLAETRITTVCNELL